MLNIITTDDISREGTKCILTYGNAGIGKTMMIATAEDPIMIDIEGGSESLSKSNMEKVWDKSRPIPCIQIRNISDWREVFRAIKSKSAEFKPYRTLCIDSLSEITGLIYNHYVMEEGPSKIEQRKINGYQHLKIAMGEIVRVLRNSEDHDIYATATIQVLSKDESAGMPYSHTLAMYSKNLAGDIMHQFDEIYAMLIQKEEKKDRRLLLTRNDGVYNAKSRCGLLDQYELPNLKKLFDKLRAKSEPAKGEETK